MPDDKIYPVYLLKGKEPVRRAEALTALIDRLTDPAFRDFDLERLDGRQATAETILSSAANVPFASARRLTIVDDAQRMDGEAAQKLQKTLPAQLGPQSVVILVAGEAGDGQKTQGTLRRLESLAKSMGVVRAYDALKTPEAVEWLNQTARRAGKTMDGPARTELLARVGLHLGALGREMEKLVAYSGNRASITRADVVAVAPESTEYSVFVLVDAVSEGKAALALKTLHGLRANNEPAQRIMPLLARQLRLVWQAKLLAEDRSAADRLPTDPNFLRQAPFVQDKVRRQAARVSWGKLRRGLRLLLEKDLALKGIEGPPTNDDEALETLVAALCEK